MGEFYIREIFSKKYIEEKLTTNYIIVLSFVLLSIISSIFMIRSNVVISSWDINFHWSRILDMQQSLIHGRFFDDVAISGFNQSGSGSMSLYPKINLIPIVILGLFIKSYVHLIYFIFIIRNILGLLVSYYSCLSITKNKFISYVFSISYTLSTVTLFYSFRSMDMGVSSSLIYIPLIIFGCIEILRKNSWKELTVGLSLIIGSHVITSIISIMFIILMFSINYRKLKDKEILSSITKFVVITMLLTSVVWIPLVVISINNHISMPVVLTPLTGVDFNTFLSSFANNDVSQYLTIIAVMGIILSIVNYKSMSTSSKQIFWISLFLILISSSLFPWNFFNGTFLKESFQFPYRFLLISQPILCYLFSVNLFVICYEKKINSMLMFSLVSIFVVMSQISGQVKVNHMDKPYDFNHIGNNGLLYTDYWPSRSILYNMVNDHYAFDGSRKIHVDLIGNGNFIFKVPKKTFNIQFPFMIYNSIRYRVELDGKSIGYVKDENNILNIENIDKGKHDLSISVIKSSYDIFSYIFTGIGFVLLICVNSYFFKKIIKKFLSSWWGTFKWKINRRKI